MIDSPRYSTSQICKGLKIPQPQFREWIARKYIIPTIPAAGRGKAAKFTEKDVLCILLFMRMVGLGFSREFAAGFVTGFRSEKQDLSFRLIYPAYSGPESIANMTGEDLVFNGKTGDISYVALDGKPHVESGWDRVILLNIVKMKEIVVKAMKGI